MALLSNVTIAQTDDPGFGVYVHWPFCLAKCPYCDFNSHVRHGGVDEARFVRALLAELDHMAARIGPRTVRSVFFGGGTPSLMSAGAVAAVLNAIDIVWSLSDDAEITLEANPTSAEAKKFRGYRDAGVSRLSLGVQALNDRDLKALGRRHDSAEALAAVALARRNFDRVSFDLIYARPHQRLDDWRRELSAALKLGAGHMSLYQLTIEPETPFAALHAAGKLTTPCSDDAAILYEATQDIMHAAGLPAYEISNHARPGEACRHNLIYWRGGEWAGIGPGAHGRLVVDGARRDTATVRLPEAWAAQVETRGHGLACDIPLDAAEQAAEIVLTGLRLAEGVDLGRLAALGWQPPRERLARLAHEGFVEAEGQRLRATGRGRMVLDAIVAELTH